MIIYGLVWFLGIWLNVVGMIMNYRDGNYILAMVSSAMVGSLVTTGFFILIANISNRVRW